VPVFHLTRFTPNRTAEHIAVEIKDLLLDDRRTEARLRAASPAPAILQPDNDIPF
jgi:hypothetical protein